MGRNSKPLLLEKRWHGNKLEGHPSRELIQLTHEAVGKVEKIREEAKEALGNDVETDSEEDSSPGKRKKARKKKTKPKAKPKPVPTKAEGKAPPKKEVAEEVDEDEDEEVDEDTTVGYGCFKARIEEFTGLEDYIDSIALALKVLHHCPIKRGEENPPLLDVIGFERKQLVEILKRIFGRFNSRFGREKVIESIKPFEPEEGRTLKYILFHEIMLLKERDGTPVIDDVLKQLDQECANFDAAENNPFFQLPDTDKYFELFAEIEAAGEEEDLEVGDEIAIARDHLELGRESIPRMDFLTGIKESKAVPAPSPSATPQQEVMAAESVNASETRETVTAQPTPRPQLTPPKPKPTPKPQPTRRPKLSRTKAAPQPAPKRKRNQAEIIGEYKEEMAMTTKISLLWRLIKELLTLEDGAVKKELLESNHPLFKHFLESAKPISIDKIAEHVIFIVLSKGEKPAKTEITSVLEALYDEVGDFYEEVKAAATEDNDDDDEGNDDGETSGSDETDAEFEEVGGEGATDSNLSPVEGEEASADDDAFDSDALVDDDNEPEAVAVEGTRVSNDLMSEALRNGISAKQWEAIAHMAMVKSSIKVDEIEGDVDEGGERWIMEKFTFEKGKIIGKGDFSFKDNQDLRMLPEGFEIEGNLDIRGCSNLTEPQDLVVHGETYRSGDDIASALQIATAESEANEAIMIPVPAPETPVLNKIDEYKDDPSNPKQQAISDTEENNFLFDLALSITKLDKTHELREQLESRGDKFLDHFLGLTKPLEKNQVARHALTAFVMMGKSATPDNVNQMLKEVYNNLSEFVINIGLTSEVDSPDDSGDDEAAIDPDDVDFDTDFDPEA